MSLTCAKASYRIAILQSNQKQNMSKVKDITLRYELALENELLALAENMRTNYPNIDDVKNGEDSIYDHDTQNWSDQDFEDYFHEVNRLIRQYDEEMSQLIVERHRIKSAQIQKHNVQRTSRIKDLDEDFENYRDNKLTERD